MCGSDGVQRQGVCLGRNRCHASVTTTDLDREERLAGVLTLFWAEYNPFAPLSLYGFLSRSFDDLIAFQFVLLSAFLMRATL
jgi:hypothetical protein